MARQRIASFQTVNINFYPRESHLVTFQDPWSFPILFHPGCNNLVREHLKGLAQKVIRTPCMNASNILLTWKKGRLSLCFLGRVPYNSVLPAPISHTRSRRYVLSFGAFYSRGAGPVCTVPAELSAPNKPSPGCATSRGPFYGPVCTSSPRIYISSHGP